MSKIKRCSTCGHEFVSQCCIACVHREMATLHAKLAISCQLSQLQAVERTRR